MSGRLDEPDFFRVLSSDARASLLARSQTLKVRRGQTVVTHGSVVADVFFVLEGQLQGVLYSRDGREVLMSQVGPGDVFGELAAIDGLGCLVSVVATSDARLLKVGSGDFNAAAETSAAAAHWLARRLAAQVRDLTERLFELTALSVKARLHRELLRLARASTGASRTVQPKPGPTHAELANRIGTHREAVTREMRILSERNIIRNRRRYLEFIDLPGLEAIVRPLGGEFPLIRDAN